MHLENISVTVIFWAWKGSADDEKEIRNGGGKQDQFLHSLLQPFSRTKASTCMSMIDSLAQIIVTKNNDLYLSKAFSLPIFDIGSKLSGKLII